MDRQDELLLNALQRQQAGLNNVGTVLFPRTYEQYITRWDDDGYVAWLWHKKHTWNLDACSVVPDHYLMGCLEHDVTYRIHDDPYNYYKNGEWLYENLSRKEADRNLRWYMAWQNGGDEWYWGLLGAPRRWLWWGVLRLRAGNSWKTGPSRIPKG